MRSKRRELLLIGSLLVLASALGTGAAGCEQGDQCKALAAPATPKDWQRVEQRDGFVLFLPASCAPDPDMPRFVHGGSQWRCGSVTVELIWGMWGANTVADAAGEEASTCRATLSGVPVLVSTAGKHPRRAVWYRTGFVHEPLVVARSAAATDAQLLEAITRSGILTGPRGPNR